MTEPAFAGAGKVAGLEVWRIEALKPVKQNDVSVSSMKILILTIVSVYTNFFSIHSFMVNYALEILIFY